MPSARIGPTTSTSGASSMAFRPLKIVPPDV
ncbi:hypothetical protein ACHAWF_016596 [Thalassiosira exigua]